MIYFRISETFENFEKNKTIKKVNFNKLNKMKCWEFQKCEERKIAKQNVKETNMLVLNNKFI